jgi:hypothetical protein
VKDNPRLLLQDCNRKLFQWFLNRADSRRILKELPKMAVFKSDWHKTLEECTFPELMPQQMRERVIRLRRMIMTHAYIQNGIGEEIINVRMYWRLCTDLHDMKSAWGHEFGFYDFQFQDWSIEKEDHLLTNRGCDSALVNHAIAILQVRKAGQRRAQQREVLV